MVEPAISELTPFVLVTDKLAEGLTIVGTVAVLLVLTVSLVPERGDSVTVLVTLVATVNAVLTNEVAMIVHCAPASALVKVPVTTVAPLTTDDAVVQLPPPTMAAVIDRTGVIKLGKVSVKAAEPVPPLAELVMVTTYCTVCPPPIVTTLVLVVPHTPTHCDLLAEKSVPTL